MVTLKKKCAGVSFFSLSCNVNSSSRPQKSFITWRALVLGFWVVFKNPRLFTSDDSSEQSWFILKTLVDVLTQLHAAFLLVSHGTIFAHAQIFGVNLPNTVLFHVQQACHHLNSQPPITTHNLLYLLDVRLSSARWRLPFPGVIFHLLAPLFEPLVPLKSTCSWHCVISIHLL